MKKEVLCKGQKKEPEKKKDREKPLSQSGHAEQSDFDRTYNGDDHAEE